MKYLFPKGFNHFKLVSICLLLILSSACKKEVTEVKVDPFVQLETQVESNQGIYEIRFSLQDYDYNEVGVKMGTNKTMFFQNKDLSQLKANLSSLKRYSVFTNSLSGSTTYYYQIYVKDASDKEVLSDLYAFTTTP
jgi:hypothetical protein